MAAIQPAGAAVIPAWQFSVTSQWGDTVWASTGANSKDPANPKVTRNTLPSGEDYNGAGQYNVLKWGTPVPGGTQSFLAVDQNITNVAYTNDPNGAAGANVFHGNFAQRVSELYPYEKVLRSTSLTASITITPAGIPGAPEYGPITRGFDIEFRETRNDGPIEACPGGFDASETPCPDWFTVSLANASFETGVIDFVIYTFTLKFDDAASTYLRATYDGDTATVWTAEDWVSRLATYVVVTARVPEPGAVGLMGMGLLGLGLVAGRRRS